MTVSRGTAYLGENREEIGRLPWVTIVPCTDFATQAAGFGLTGPGTDLEMMLGVGVRAAHALALYGSAGIQCASLGAPPGAQGESCDETTSPPRVTLTPYLPASRGV